MSHERDPTEHRWTLDEGDEGPVELRRLSESDVGLLFARLDTEREHLRPWMAWIDGVQSEADVRHFIEDSHAVGPDGPRAFEFGVFTGPHLVGAVGLNQLDFGQGLANLGYWVGRGYEGRGWITAATRRLSTFGLGNLGLARVEIRTAKANRRSQRVAEGAGFVREGCLRSAQAINGQRHDLVVYGRIRSDSFPTA